tara:strand:- start:257 stop:565 length:309 start_codon:yes stop_codon:yes gene_type:complete
VHTDEVVRVHDGVDETVKYDGKINVTIVKYVRVQPVEQKDGNMMINMQEGELSPFFPQDDKNSIPKIPNLCNIKQPEEVGQCWIIPIVPDAWGDRVPVTVRQ